MRATTIPASPESILPLRVRYRREMNCQVVHDSLHRRNGWTNTFALQLDRRTAGFASVAVGGPWLGDPTIVEFYVLPEDRGRAFQLFEVFLDAAGALRMTVQSNDVLPTVMLHAYARDVRSEALVFRDAFTTAIVANDVRLEQVSTDEAIRAAMTDRQGGGEWRLQFAGQTVGTGGILFHYNAPYGDIYMDVVEPFRRRGFGSFLVQELKRLAYTRGAIPAARCSPGNVASRRTLQKAGLVPYAHLLSGSIAPAIET